MQRTRLAGQENDQEMPGGLSDESAQSGSQGICALQALGGGGNDFVRELIASGESGRSSAPGDGKGNTGASTGGWGTQIDSFDGVAVYSNAGKEDGGPQGEYGMEFQCVEFVNRYAVQALGMSNMSGTGHAVSYSGWSRPGYTWVPNTPGPNLPASGDILVFGGGSYGHVAICTSASEQSVGMVQQNTSSSRGSVGVGEGKVLDDWGGMEMLGWQHAGAVSDAPVASGEETGDKETGDPPAAGYGAVAESHVVVAGDTLSGIAAATLGDAGRYVEIAALNGIVPPYVIYPGQRLLLPDGASGGGSSTAAATTSSTYTVVAGDTLSGIAATLLGDPGRSGEIAALNGIANPDLIFEGQVLQIPPGAGASNATESEAWEDSKEDQTEEAQKDKDGRTTEIVFKRREIHLTGDDKYGHWWTEIDSDEAGQYAESYGWWPKHSVGLVDTLWGTEGELNGQTTFGGTATRDPHHGDAGEKTFYARIQDPNKSVQTAMDEIRTFANGYSGEWRWTFGWGQNCHTFQEQMMAKVGLTLSA